MSNILKLSGALKVGSFASDPVGIEDGTIYYNTTDGVFRQYADGSWNDIASGSVSLEGQALLENEVIVGNGSDLSAAVDTSAVGDVLADSTNGLTVKNSAITNAKMANMADQTIKGNDSGSAAAPQDLSASDVTAMLDEMVGDSGSGGTKGLVPAPATGDASKYLKGDGTWASIASAPVTSVNSQTGVVVLDSDDISEGSTNKYYTASQARSDVIASSISNGDTTHAPSGDAVFDALAGYIPSSEKGANSGVATLDGGGKIPASQLPNSVMEYKGTWAASTNTPTLANGSGNAGDVYVASDAGTVDFGAGNITFAAGDWVVYSGSIWEKSVNSNAVASVNSQTGVVVLDSDDISEGSTNKYYTASQARSDIISSSITNGDTTHSPSGDAVFDALALKQNTSTLDSDVGAAGYIKTVSADTAPTLGGDLTINSKALMGTMKRSAAADASNFIEEQYIHSTSLTASTTAVIAALTVAHATYQGMKIQYSVKEATTNNVRIGTLMVTTNGTAVGINDSYSDTADMTLSFSAAINGSNIEVSYTKGANAATLRMDVVRFKV